MREPTPEEQARIDGFGAGADNNTKFEWDDSFQSKLLGSLLTDRFVLVQAQDKVKPTYFSNEAYVMISGILFDFFQKQKDVPPAWAMKQEFAEKLKDRDKAVQLHYLGQLEALYTFHVPGLNTREYLCDKITYFAKVQAVKVAFHKCVEKMNEAPEDDKTWSFVYDQMRTAMVVERNFEPGLEYFMNIDEMFRRMRETFQGKDRFTSAFETIDNALTGGGFFPGQIVSWIGLPGTGKCNSPGSPILMYDGTIKKVEDVVVGDLVMGDDSKPRKVLSTHRLIDRKYEVRPTKGDSYFVNGKHILSLKNSHHVAQVRKDRGRRTGDTAYRNPTPCFANHPSRMGGTNIYNISVEDWFKQTQHFRTKMKGWRIGIEFPVKDVSIDPYFIGVWLGDGSRNFAEVTNMDAAVISAVYSEASSRKLEIYVNRKNNTSCCSYRIFSSESKKKGTGRCCNSLLEDLKFYDLRNNKHIPHDYKVNSREVRLQVLAGLLDTDGELSANGYSITQKHKVLADDICFLARSLGLAAYKKECRKKCQTGVVGTYYRVSISGDCSVIPVRIARKKAQPRKQVKDVLLTGIEIFDTGEMDEFYGFEVDGNHLFLLGDFTVVHNSLGMVKAAVANVLMGHKVLYLTMEMDELGIAQRFTSQMLKKDINNLLGMELEIRKEIEEFCFDKAEKNLLRVTQFPGGTMTVNHIRAYYNQLMLRGWKPDLLIIDYVGEMADDPNLKKYESAYRILRDLRAFGIEEKHGTMTCIQPNASAAKLEIGQYIDESNIGTSFDQFKPLDAFWSINQQTIEKDAEVGRGFIIKHRNGQSRKSFRIGFDYRLGTLDMFEISKDKYREAMNAIQDKKSDEVQIDAIDMGSKKKQRSRSGFKPNAAIEPSEEELRGE